MRNYIKMVCFFFILNMGVILLGKLLQPKTPVEIAVDNYHSIHGGIYELEDNTLDIVYIGSSHVFSSISPEDIFENYGFTGYVLASSSQKIWQSYYYLQEAYETQSPKIVVLDTFMALDGNPQIEAFNREAIDAMKLSPAKIGAVNTAVKFNSNEEDFWSYFFPVLRYHERWEELKKEDFIWFLSESDAPMKGFLARRTCNPAVFNAEKYADTAIEPAELNEVCHEYLDKIKKLCDKNGSRLVLTKFPTCLWDGSSSAAIQKWAYENGIPFLDYNADAVLRDKVNIDWETDSLDGGNHLNYAGAMKMTDVFGKYLAEEFELEDKRNDSAYQQWHTDYTYYKRCVANDELSHMTDITEYLERMKNEDYLVILSCNNIDVSVSETAKTLLQQLGMSEEYLIQAAHMNNLLILENGKNVFSQTSEQDIIYKQFLSGVSWDISCQIRQDGTRIFCCINNRTNWTTGENGIQFVIWDTVTQNIIDSSYAVLNEVQELELIR